MLHHQQVHYILVELEQLYLIGYIQKSNGKFYLRIEDTDQERSKDEYKDQIIKSLNWIGIKYDGEEYIQSKKVNDHIKVANELKNGHAYKCYCSTEEIEEQKKEQDKKRSVYL